jgi:aminobenzoyl-glutamate transport protein
MQERLHLRLPRPNGKRGALDAFLDTIERVGNAVPHPAIIFLVLIALVIALSALLSR